MITLVARSFGRVKASFATILLILAGFQVALVAMAASVATSGDFDRLAQIVPAFLQTAIAPALMSFGRMTTLGYFHALIVMVVVQWAIYVATEPAGEVESGLLDLVLARPLSRHRLITRSFLVMTGSTLTLVLGMGLGTLLGLSLLAPPDAAWPEPRVLFLMMAHLTLLACCFGAAGLAAAGWARRRATALAAVAIAAVAMYLVDFLGLWWEPAEAMSRLTPFFYFRGGPILAGTANPALDLSALGGATIAATGVAYWRFARRDL